MTLEKTVMRASVVHELGEKADDFLEAYRNELREIEGVVNGIGRALTIFDAIFAGIDKEIDERQIDFEAGKKMKEWALRGMEQLKNLRTQAANQVYLTRGKVDAAARQVEYLKKSYDIEKIRIAQYQTPPSSAAEAGNVVDINSAHRDRPTSLKTRRIQEGVQEPPPVKKKRGRKPKNQNPSEQPA